MKRYLTLKIWQDFHSSVWKEIVSRFGQSEYDDETKRKKHIETLKAEWEAAKYKRNRAEAYPSIADQLDNLYHNALMVGKPLSKQSKINIQRNN